MNKFAKLNKIFKRTINNKSHVLTISIIIMLTITMTVHLSPTVLVRCIHTPITYIVCMLLLGISVYYKSFMLGLLSVLCMVLIQNRCKSLEITGYSDDSIFSQVKVLTELYENHDESENTYETVHEKESKKEIISEDIEYETPLAPPNVTSQIMKDTVNTSPTQTLSEKESVEPSLAIKIGMALKRIQDNVFPEKSKLSNKESPILCTSEYCAQGSLTDAPTGYNSEQMVTHEII